MPSLVSARYLGLLLLLLLLVGGWGPLGVENISVQERELLLYQVCVAQTQIPLCSLPLIYSDNVEKVDFFFFTSAKERNLGKERRHQGRSLFILRK